MRSVLTVIFAWASCAGVFSQWQAHYPQISTSVDVSVAAPNYVFLIVEEAPGSKILKSADGARTWKHIELGSEELTSIFFTDSLTGYVTSYKGVYKTTDGARSWQLKTLPAGFPTPRDIVFTGPSVGYVRSGNNKIAKTTDGGSTWSSLATAPLSTSEFGNSFSFANEDTGYAVADSKLYKSTNGGSQWSQVSFNYNVAYVYAVTPDVVYLSNGSNLYKTSNGGQTWDPTNYSAARLIHFINVDEGLFFADYSDVLKTNTGGATMRYVFDSNFSFSWRQVSFAGAFGCAIGSDNALVTTHDGGDTWKLNEIRPQHGEFRDVHFTSDQAGFIVGENRGMIRTDDNAISWYYDEDHFDRDDLYKIAFSDPDTGIFVVTNNYAFTTHDAGETMFLNGWTPPIIGHQQSYDYDMVTSKILYSVGEAVKVAKSIDGGKSWTPFNFNLSNSFSAIACLDANTCHAVGNVGALVSTWDGGAHWKVHDLPLNNDLREVYLVNQEVGFIGGSAGMILRTTNGGQNWSVLSTGSTGAIVSFQFMTATKGYAISAYGEVFRTDNGGESWVQKQTMGLPNGTYYPIVKTFMRDTTHVYAITASQIIRWTLPDVVTAIESSERSITIYPNPTEGALRIRASEPVVGIMITDTQGALLRTYESQIHDMNVSDLPPGMYIMQIILPSRIQVNKIIKR